MSSANDPSQPPGAGPEQQTTPTGAAAQAPGYPPAPDGPAPGQYPAGYVPIGVAGRTNGLAIASLVLGILWIYWVGSILALVFGYLARKQIREGNQQGDGMALAGIVLGWVGVGVLGLLILVGLIGYAVSY